MRRVVRYFPSAARPVLVATDVANGYLKGAESPTGPSALIAELVAAEIGTQMDLAIPPFAIVRGIDLEIQMMDHNGIVRPPAFFSKHVDGSTDDGSDLFVKRLKRVGDLARLIVFDTWIRNCDRCHKADGGVYDFNRDNLIFETSGDQQYQLAPIDHSHCIIDIDFVSSELTDPALIRDDNVYGFFPEFAPYISANAVASAMEAMLSVNRDALDEIVNSVPAEWGLGTKQRVELVDFLDSRAKFLAETLPMKLVEQPLLRNLSS